MKMFKWIRIHILILLFSFNTALAGDDASGSISYSLDLSKEFTEYTMTDAAKKWSRSLIKNLHFNGHVTHFVKTSIKLNKDSSVVEGAVYHAIELPEYYYVVDSDMIVKLGASHVYSPGSGGFSMHMPRSRNFIVCLNLLSGGVPALRSSPVTQGKVQWRGHEWTRFQ